MGPLVISPFASSRHHLAERHWAVAMYPLLASAVIFDGPRSSETFKLDQVRQILSAEPAIQSTVRLGLDSLELVGDFGWIIHI